MVAMSTESLRTVKDRFSQFEDRVQRQHERVIITKNGRPAAVLVSVDDLESLEETLSILSDPTAMDAIRRGEAALDAGDHVEGVEATRALLTERGRTRTA